MMNQPMLQKITIIGKVNCKSIETRVDVVNFDNFLTCKKSSPSPMETTTASITNSPIMSSVNQELFPYTVISVITETISSFSSADATESILTPPLKIIPTKIDEKKYVSPISIFPTKSFVTPNFPYKSSTISTFSTKDDDWTNSFYWVASNHLSNTQSHVLETPNHVFDVFKHTHEKTTKTTKKPDQHSQDESNPDDQDSQDEGSSVVLGISFPLVVILLLVCVFGRRLRILERCKRKIPTPPPPPPSSPTSLAPPSSPSIILPAVPSPLPTIPSPPAAPSPFPTIPSPASTQTEYFDSLETSPRLIPPTPPNSFESNQISIQQEYFDSLEDSTLTPTNSLESNPSSLSNELDNEVCFNKKKYNLRTDVKKPEHLQF